MIILIDMDDTMIDLLVAWCNYLNKKYGECVDPSKITDWDISLFFPNLNSDDVYEPLRDEELWKEVRPKPGAAEYIERLIKDGNEVYIVTAGDYRTIKFRFDYVIKRFFPFLKSQNVIMTTNKQMIKGDILIDDGVHNLRGGDYEKILVSAPHNSAYDASRNGMNRAKSWDEIYNLVQEINNRKGQSNESY